MQKHIRNLSAGSNHQARNMLNASLKETQIWSIFGPLGSHFGTMLGPFGGPSGGLFGASVPDPFLEKCPFSFKAPTKRALSWSPLGAHFGAVLSSFWGPLGIHFSAFSRTSSKRQKNPQHRRQYHTLGLFLAFPGASRRPFWRPFLGMCFFW